MGKFLLFMIVSLGAVQQVSVVPLTALQHRVAQPNDTLYVVNFWATWCKPCVEEMPDFESAQEKVGAEKVKVLFAGLNSVKERNSVQQFVERKNIQSETFVLQVGNPNVWINQIDSSWSGALPATVFYKNGKKVFFIEDELHSSQLDSLISLHKSNRP